MPFIFNVLIYGALNNKHQFKEVMLMKFSVIYIRCNFCIAEGAKRYSMCKHTFMKLAQEAHAVYKINRLTLVNTRVFEEYLESFRV